jgi:PRTRC genetic system protein A
MNLNIHDQFLQSQVPTVMVPKYEPLAPLVGDSHRVIMASNGVYIEARRSWMHVIKKVADFGVKLPVPYGEAEEVTELFIDFPLHLVREFYFDALDKHPNECSAWIILNTDTGEFRYQMLEEIVASMSYLEVHNPILTDNETLIIDIHSHGYHSAEFSDLDDKDDAGAYKISGVIGSLGAGQIESASFRLCVGGLFIPLSFNPSQLFAKHNH